MKIFGFLEVFLQNKLNVVSSFVDNLFKFPLIKILNGKTDKKPRTNYGNLRSNGFRLLLQFIDLTLSAIIYYSFLNTMMISKHFFFYK